MNLAARAMGRRMEDLVEGTQHRVADAAAPGPEPDPRQAPQDQAEERQYQEDREHVGHRVDGIAFVATRGNKPSYTLSMSKVMISLPDDLLVELDAEAKRRSTSRSALLAAAARRELARKDPAEIAAAIARSEHRFRGVGAFDSANLVRSDRDDRR